MKISISLDEALYEKLREFAQLNDLKVSQVVRFALREYFERLENPEKE